MSTDARPSTVPSSRRATRTHHTPPDGVLRQVARWLWRSSAAQVQLLLAAVVTAVITATLGIRLGALIDHSERAVAVGQSVLGDEAWTLALYLAPATLVLVFPTTLALQLPTPRLARPARPGAPAAVGARVMTGAAAGLASGLASWVGAAFGAVLALTIWGQPLIVFRGDVVFLLLRLFVVCALFGVIGALLAQIFPGRRSRHVLVGVALVIGLVVEPAVRFYAVGDAALAQLAQWWPSAIADAVTGSPGLYRAPTVAATSVQLPALVATAGLVGVVVVLALIAAARVRGRS